ncbi:hypothetical protein V8C44DRAFT_338486 [Trichoderma aethiopicum]
MGAVRSALPTFIAMVVYLPVLFFRRLLRATKNMIFHAEDSILRYRNLLNSKYHGRQMIYLPQCVSG